jgi:hypothetical protein
MQQITFEKLGDDSSWVKIQDDPDDEDFEIIDPVPHNVLYSQIENLKKKGWKVKQDVDPAFSGFILVKDSSDGACP